VRLFNARAFGQTAIWSSAEGALGRHWNLDSAGQVLASGRGLFITLQRSRGRQYSPRGRPRQARITRSRPKRIRLHHARPKITVLPQEFAVNQRREHARCSGMIANPSIGSVEHIHDARTADLDARRIRVLRRLTGWSALRSSDR